MAHKLREVRADKYAYSIMSTKSAETLLWKHEYDVKL